MQAAVTRGVCAQSAAEAELDRLDALARELSACGNTKLMVDALHHLQHKQTLAAGRDAGDDAATLPAAADDREQRDMVRALLSPSRSCRQE